MSLAHEIDTIVAGAIERRMFPGAVVLVAVGDTICHHAAYGTTMCDAPESQPVARTTIYDIASLTKLFTATAALRLSDQGALDLRAPVVAYLPGFGARDVTVWHLLTHTSGLDIRLSTLRHAGRAGLLAAAYAVRPAHPPGTTVAYTNVNSLLLGEIVAHLQGTPLDDALGALVLNPLGLRDTQFCPPSGLRPRIAPTEMDEEWRGGLVHGGVHDESAHALGGVAGHAGLFSTAQDMYTFCQMWVGVESVVRCQLSVVGDGTPITTDNGQRTTDTRTGNRSVALLRRDTIAMACTNHTTGLNLGCGLGWMLDRPNFMGAAPPGTFGHTGFTGPAVVVVPQRQLIVIVLNNRVYPRRRPPEHHAVTAGIVGIALRAAG
jgi:serine-type D-Ala-D-Ala carboxypeptidase